MNQAYILLSSFFLICTLYTQHSAASSTIGQVQKAISDFQTQTTNLTKATETQKPLSPAENNNSEISNNDPNSTADQFKVKQPISDQNQILKDINNLNAINAKLLQTDQNEQQVQQLLDKKTSQLSRLMELLRTTQADNLPLVTSNERMNFLDSRISINEERGNKLAVLRDRVQREYLLTQQNTRQFILDLISANKNYQSTSEIEDIAEKALAETKKQATAFEIPAQETSSQSTIYDDLQTNYTQLLQVTTTYQDILNYVIDNPQMISSTHWFQYITLNTSVSFFNSLDLAKPINQKLAPFKLDVGGIVTSLLIYFLIYFSFPVLFSFIHWLIQTFFLDGNYSSEEILYDELQRPIQYVLTFIGIDMGTYALLYKTQFRTSLESISFVFYVLFDIWFVFKVLDCYVLVKIQSISKTNKELRKELFNLGVQVAKGIAILIGIAILLNHFGISITAIMSTLGIGGLAFALAAKDSLSNLFGGVTVLLDNVFKMGDWVKIDDVEGTVADIGLRSTTIRTFDNALVTIPNSVISVSSVINWNRRAVGRRIKMYIPVTYESNMEDIRQTIEDLRNMLQKHPGIANPKQKIGSSKRQFRFSSHEDSQGIKSTQLVYMDKFNDYSIDILVYCFSRTVNWSDWLEVKEDVLFKIAAIVQKNNLEFAYPTQVRIYKEGDEQAEYISDF